jgi:hypothetical protein
MSHDTLARYLQCAAVNENVPISPFVNELYTTGSICVGQFTGTGAGGNSNAGSQTKETSMAKPAKP